MMLSHRKEDTEKRNEHLKHMVLALVILAFLAAAPDLVFMIAGVDIDTGCALDDENNCLAQEENSIEGELFGNIDVGLLVYKIAIAVAALLAIAYKGIAA